MRLVAGSAAQLKKRWVVRFPLTGSWRRRRDAVAGQPRPGGVRRPGRAAEGAAGRGSGTARLPFRRRRRPKALPAAFALCLLAAALAVLAELGPGEAPYRTPAVRA